MKEVVEEEYEYILHSEKMFRMIVTTYVCMRDFLNTPFYFYYDVNPVSDRVDFTAVFWDSKNTSQRMKLSLRIDDYRPDEICDEIKLAYHVMDVWRP